MNKVRYGILDTCVFIDVDKIEASALPDESYVTTISLAELAAGPHAAQDPNERAQRQDRLQSVETNFEALPFDASAARAYGRVYALELAGGRKSRGARTMDLLIAAIAVAENLTLYTRNPEDFASLTGILNIIVV